MSDRVIALREAFAQFLGKEQFRKFAKQGMPNGRMKFWQESLWKKFIDSNPDYASFENELQAAIRICDIHGEELLRGEVPIVRGKIRLLERLLGTNFDAMSRYFPNSNSAPFFVGDQNVEGETHEVWYCPTCRENEADYRKYMVAKDETDEDD